MRAHLIATMGAPGAGKSTWASDYAHVISTDAIRHGADPGKVYRVAMGELEYRLRVGQEVVFDATLASSRTRAHLLEIARRTCATSTLVVFDTPLDLCIERQQARGIPVPAEVVRASWEAIVLGARDLDREGWDEITHVEAMVTA